MAEKLTLPEPASALGRCPHCGAEIKIDQHWYARLQQIVEALNSLLP